MAEVTSTPKFKVIELTTDQLAESTRLSAEYHNYMKLMNEARAGRDNLLQSIAGKDNDWRLSDDEKYIMVQSKGAFFGK